MGKNNDYYGDLISSINAAKDADVDIFRSGGTPVNKNRNTDDMEIFSTSEDIAKNKRLEQETLKGGRARSLPPDHVEETIHFNRINKGPRKRRYTETEIESFREGSKRVLVHDYSENDFYHQDNETRAKQDLLAKISMKLGGLKRIYRSIDKYIEAMRIVYEAWSILADTNPLHTREEFFEYVAKGIIISNRIIIPKLKGIDNYNIDLIFEYINNTHLDPKDLADNPREDMDEFYYDEEYDPEAEINRMLDMEEQEYVAVYNHDPNSGESMRVQGIKRRYLKAYDDDLNHRRRKKKNKKKGSKTDERVSAIISGVLKRIQGNHYQKDFTHSFGLTENFFGDKKERTIFDRSSYDGSWQDDDTAALYDLAMDEEHLNDNLGDDRYLTYGDQEMQKFYRTLEANGVNTVELRRRISGNDEKYLARKKEDSKRKNKKIEQALMKRIQELPGNPKFQRLIKKSEKAMQEYRKDLANNKRED